MIATSFRTANSLFSNAYNWKSKMYLIMLLHPVLLLCLQRSYVVYQILSDNWFWLPTSNWQASNFYYRVLFAISFNWGLFYSVSNHLITLCVVSVVLTMPLYNVVQQIDGRKPIIFMLKLIAKRRQKEVICMNCFHPNKYI